MRGTAVVLAAFVLACGPKVTGLATYYARCDVMADCNAKAMSACGKTNDLIDSTKTNEGGFVAKYACGDERPSEIQPREEGPSTGETVLRVLGGAAGGAAAGMQQSQPSPPPSRGCRSDYDCGGPGYVCAKPAGSYTGECAKAVNSFGNQDFMNSPRLDSNGPGRRQCSLPLDCGIGFTCDRGICIKR